MKPKNILQKFLSIGYIIGTIFWFTFGVQVATATSTFKCPQAPRPGFVLGIWVVTLETDAVNESGDPLGFQESDTGVFCAEQLASFSDSVIDKVMYDTLVQASGGLLKSSWINGGEIHMSIFDIQSTREDKWVDAYSANDLKKDYLIIANKNCTLIAPNQREYSGRCRYHLPELSNGDSNKFLYFLKIASPDQLPMDSTACQNKYQREGVCTAECFLWLTKGQCYAKADANIKCSDLPQDICSSGTVLHCKIGNSNTCVEKSVQVNQAEAIDQFISSTHGKPDGYDGPLPPCAFTGTCRSVEDLIGLGVKIADWLFGIIAGLGFAFFVYGGITMIFSFGNAEKVTQGKQILVAATIGIVIAFSAYVLVGFVVKAIGITPGLTPFN